MRDTLESTVRYQVENVDLYWRLCSSFLCIFSFTSGLLKTLFLGLSLRHVEKSYLAENIMRMPYCGTYKHVLCSLTALCLLLAVIRGTSYPPKHVLHV